MVEEVTASPMRQIAELVQFIVLAAIVWVVAMGFGKRKGFVLNMLAERRELLGSQIEEALGSEGRLTTAQHEAAAKERAARAEARRVVAEAHDDAERIVSGAQVEADAEAAQVTERAKAALVSEREEMELELKDRLIEAVAAATRAIMDEQLTVSEQRTLIESAISASVNPGGVTARRTAEKVPS
jgi:F0F1-type ATP synthase membrane subunit b/b'